MTHKTEKRTTDVYGDIPIYFIPNKGQLEDNRIQYYAKGAGCEVFFTNEGASFIFREGTTPFIENNKNRGNKKESKKKGRGFRLDFRFLGANQGVKPEAREEMPGKVNYFKGNNSEKGYTNISVFQEVIYREVWPGIDLVFRGEQGQIKYEFILQPRAKVEDIRFTYEGAEKLSLDEEGNVLMDTPFGVMMDTFPVSYHVKDGNHLDVESAFQLISGDKGKAVITYTMGKSYDSRYPLIIDPGLVYSTYLGGSSTDTGSSIAVDTAGNVYVTGRTDSADFPTTPGAFDPTFNGVADAFVTKLNPTGTALVYSTYLGGSNFDQGSGIAVDTAGNAYVTGLTQSANFPTTPGAFDLTFNGDVDAFVTKLNPTGTALVYSTYLGGSGTDQGLGITVDTSGNVYVTGFTDSANFPTTPGAFDLTFNGDVDAFVTKLNPTGTALVYSTYLGGSGNDQGRGIAVDIAGNAYVIGLTQSANFPTTPGAFDLTFNGVTDAFVTKLNPTGTALVYSTYLGGSGTDQGLGITVDTSGNVYVTGFTDSANFPTTPGAFDLTFNGVLDAFVTKLNPTGTALVYSTYLGGSGNDRGLGIAVDIAGNAYVTGLTQSANFPTTPGAFDLTFNGVIDAFVTKLNPTGTALVYSTYLGGSNSDQGFGIAVDTAGNAYVTGLTDSADFPTTPDAFDLTFNGVTDAFVTKLNPTGTALVYSTYLGGSGGDQGGGIAVDIAGNAYVTGLTDSADFPTTPGAFDLTFNGVIDAFVTKFSTEPRVPLLLELVLTKDVQVQSDVTLAVQGKFCEPRTTLRTNQETTPFSLQEEDHITCIHAKRVHDWVVFCTDHQKSVLIPEDCALQIATCRNAGGNVTVRCEAVPGSSSFTVIDDTKPAPKMPGVRMVVIRFSVLVRIQYDCNGTPLCNFDVSVTTVDKIILCYPEGTSIVAKISAVACSVVGENC